jgi:hypothetical protein
MEWKALANAIVHNGYDPQLRVTYIGCEKCHNPFLRILYSSDNALPDSDLSRVTVTIYECPECGHKELDCIGTYELPDYLPKTVVQFIGHFSEVWYNLLKFSSKLKIGTNPQVVQVYNPSTDRYLKIDTDRGKIVSNKKTKGPYKNIPIHEGSPKE